MKVVVAVTAASGGIYARQLLYQLIDSEQVERIALIFSSNAEAVLATEGVVLPESRKIVRYSNDDMFASVASGSQNWDAMVVVPSSVGTVARIATGTSQSLIERAADVMRAYGGRKSSEWIKSPAKSTSSRYLSSDIPDPFWCEYV